MPPVKQQYSILPNLPKLHQGAEPSRIFPSIPKPYHYTKPAHILEVERKFLPTKSSISRLRANEGNPPFGSFKPLGVCHTHDVYYDRNNMLLSQGIYVRLRNRAWEAKVRQGGDYTNSQFREYEGEEGVVEIVKRAWEMLEGNGREFKGYEKTDTILQGLKPIAEFKTKRAEWAIDGFRVVVDQADFGHTVGEVELCFDVENEGEEVGLEMDEKIEGFMKGNAWAFPEGKAMGKLAAYWQWKARMELGLAFPVPDWVGGKE